MPVSESELGAAADEEAVLNVTRSDLSQQMSEHAPQWVKQFLRWQRAFLQLRLYGPHDFLVRPAKIEEAEPTQAVDVLPAQHILEGCAAPRPFDCREVTRFRDRLPILDKSAIVIFGEVVDGCFDQPLGFAFAQALFLDDVEVPLRIVEGLE